MPKLASWVKQIETFIAQKYDIDIKNDIDSLGNEKQKRIKLSLLDYFGISKLDMKMLSENLDLTGLDLFLMLDGYKKYIEVQLKGIAEEYKLKIKKAISIRMTLINIEIEQLKEIEKKRFLNLSKFRENRWIVNHKIIDIFDEVNRRILPSAFFLVHLDVQNARKDLSVRHKYVKEIFDSPLLEKGNFSESFFGQRKLLHSLNKNDRVYLDQLAFTPRDIEQISLLIEMDQRVEEDVMMQYMATLGVLVANDLGKFNPIWTLPWYAIGLGYAIGDAFSDEDFAIKLLKNTQSIPQGFRLDKRTSDKIIAAMTIIPWVFTISKSKKIAEYVRNLTPEQKEKFKRIQEKMKEILRKGPSVFHRITKTISQDHEFINRILRGLKPKKSIKIGHTQIIKLESGAFKLINAKKVFTDQPIEDIDKIVEGLNEEDKMNFVLEQKIAFLLTKLVGTQREISDHTVSLEKGGVYVITSPSGTKLKGTAWKNFIENNQNEIAQVFFGYDVREWATILKSYMLESIGKMVLEDYIKEDLLVESFLLKKEFSWIPLNPEMKLSAIFDTFETEKWEEIGMSVLYSTETEHLLEEGCIIARDDLLEDTTLASDHFEIEKEFKNIGAYISLTLLNTIIREYMLD